MPEFEERRTELNQARTQKEQARLALLRSQEQQKAIQSELTQLEQGLDPNNREQVAQRERLEERRSQAEAEIRQRTSAYDRYRDLEGNIFERFRPLLANPRKLVS
jgi:chromosome segregation ATPase